MTNKLVAAWNWLDGKKTHILAFLTIALTIAQYWNGGISGEACVYACAAALGVSTVRHGQQTATDKHQQVLLQLALDVVSKLPQPKPAAPSVSIEQPVVAAPAVVARQELPVVGPGDFLDTH